MEAIIRRPRFGKRGVSNVIVVMLSLVLVTIIVANVVLWSYQMNRVDLERIQENFAIEGVSASNGAFHNYNPSEYALVGSTNLLSGNISNLAADDSLYAVFRSYYSGTSASDFVDNDISDVDSSADKGTHSNFTAEKQGPDNVYDMLREGNVAGGTSEQWASPDGYNDFGDVWDLESFAYDNSTSTAARTRVPAGSWCEYLELTHNAVLCGKIQYYAVGSSSFIAGIAIDIYDGLDWIQVYNGTGTWDAWVNVTFTERSVTKMRFSFLNTHSASHTAFMFEAAFLQRVDSANYELDLEAQWTGVDHEQMNEFLCIYAGTLSAESLKVDVWTGSTWINVIAALQPNQWNNISVSSYLNLSTFTVRFRDGLIIDDAIQDSWDIDTALLHVWSNEYTSQVEFTGSSDTQNWSQMTWTVNDAWTVGSVSVTIQLYNYALDTYSTSGDGYSVYISDSTPNAEENKTQTIVVNPTQFRNATGYWKMKVKGVKATDTQFDFEADWIELKVVQALGTVFTLKNGGPETVHLVSLWVINATHHRRYETDLYINSGDAMSYIREDIELSDRPYTIKVVTERGNISIYSEDLT